jgi:hypothetical protein
MPAWFEPPSPFVASAPTYIFFGRSPCLPAEANKKAKAGSAELCEVYRKVRPAKNTHHSLPVVAT